MDAIGVYSFDYTATNDSANFPGFHLTSTRVQVVNTSACKHAGCAFFSSGALLRLPSYNWGQNSALSFSVWFMPTQNSANATIFDIANGPEAHNILCGRKGNTDRLQFVVRRAAATRVFQAWESRPGAWKLHEWVHVVWTLERIGTSGLGWWHIYLDGTLAGRLIGLFPESVLLTSALLGESNFAADGAFVGFMDSVDILAAALGWNEVRALYMVSACGCARVVARMSCE